MSGYQAFQDYFGQINDLCCVINLLNWDTSTQMPPGGAETRGYQVSTIARIAQEKFTSPRTLEIIKAAEAEVHGEPEDTYRVRAVRQARACYEKSRRIPVETIAAINAIKAKAMQAWTRARAENDFAAFVPYLERIVTLQRGIAEAIGYAEHPYDALVQRYEPDITLRRLRALFGELKQGLLPILQMATSAPSPRTDFLEREYPEDLQKAFALDIVQKFGYDLKRGHVGIAVHPFEISFTRQDVRITTRYYRKFLPAAIFGLFHEAGHGMYEQGADPAISRSVLATDISDLYAVAGVSYGAHESQSRLWENLIGRSRTFWQNHLGQLKATFPQQLADVDLETFYRAINRVKPNFIRVEADEVTYNFHIMLRVEVEAGMLDGTLKVKDLPEFWKARMQEYLGITPPNDTLGCLQDVHWAHGNYGTFCCYTMGNIMSAQFMAAARRSVSGLDESLAQANYQPLLQWLSENIYRHGRAYSPTELLQRSTGEGLTTRPYLDYLREKYTALFGK